MQIYPKGGHGFMFRKKDWMEPLFLWTRNNKLDELKELAYQQTINKILINYEVENKKNG